MPSIESVIVVKSTVRDLTPEFNAASRTEELETLTVNAVTFSKAPSSRLVTVSGNTDSNNDVQFLKAPLPIVVMLPPRTYLRDIQFSNAPFGISVILSLKYMEVTFVPANAEAEIPVTGTIFF